MLLYGVVAVLVAVLVNHCEGNDPPGHLKPFGSHTVPLDVETLSEFPPPEEFYEKYMKDGKPVLFKSVLKNVHFPPYQFWNDEYLKKKYGHLVVEFEFGKKETRKGEIGAAYFKNFLENYKNKDIYLVKDLTKSMFEDMYVPRSIMCGGSQNYIETVVIWFSGGGTKSVVHSDGTENINCLLDGTKDLVFMDRQYKDLVEAEGFVRDGGYLELDVDKVDLKKYPKLQGVPVVKASMEPGDCLFIPTYWYHQVNSYGTRNIAVNLWFSHLPFFNYSDCEGVDTSMQTVPFVNYGYISEFKRQNMNLLGELTDLEIVTKEGFAQRFLDKDDPEIWDYIDQNKDGDLTWDELLQIDAKEMTERFKDSFRLSTDAADENPGFDHEERTVLEDDGHDEL